MRRWKISVGRCAPARSVTGKRFTPAWGDVWITGIHEEDTPDAMLSCCVFDDSLWGCGVATEAVRKFLPAAAEKYGLRTIGAFAYAENAASS